MQKILLKLFILFIVSINVLAEPYKPYPVIFVHGLGSSSGAWGAPTRLRSDSIPEDSLVSGHTYKHFLDYMDPYAIVWDEFDSTYTHPGGTPGHPNPDPAYPNKTFLEVINFNYNRGSIDRDTEYDSPDYKGQGDELWHRIKEVLDEYYGEGQWEDNRNAKVILVGHSMGALATRQAIKEDVIYHDSLLVPHLDKVITMGSPLSGSIWPTQFLRFPFGNTLFVWHPISQLNQSVVKKLRNLFHWASPVGKDDCIGV